MILSSSGNWYKAVWRWHFYAGILFAPIFISLAISGGIYLFQPQIEAALYQDLYEIPVQTSERLAPSVLVDEVTSEMDGAVVKSIRQFEVGNRTTEIRVIDEDVAKTVYVNPYNRKSSEICMIMT